MKIIGISKTERRSIYIVEKKQEFWKSGRELLKQLKISEAYINEFGYEDPLGDSEPRKEVDIKKEEDVNKYNFDIDENSGIDFIFGRKRIFIIFSYKEDMQTKFSEIMSEIFD